MTSTILRFPRFTGRLILGFLAQFGRISLLVVELFRGLSEVRIWVPRTFTEAATVGAALLSSLFAARKTTRIEPAEAIRAE